MGSLLGRIAICAGCCVLAASLLAGQQWKTAENLPGIDFSGLTDAQKATALKILREKGCSCGCDMKLAECRVVDPNCSYSKGLAEAVIGALKNGKTADDAIAAADATKWAHVQPQKILDDPVTIPVAGAPVMGPPNAPVTIVEFSDFQCPYCAAAVPEIDALLKSYPGQIRLVFKQYPLEIHSQADLAAAASVAANQQGKFWEMYYAMFASRDNLSRSNILALAAKSGLDIKRFENDIDSTAVRETVVRDVQDGDNAGVEGTPTIFIDGQKYNASIQLRVLKPILAAELKRVQAPGQTTAVR